MNKLNIGEIYHGFELLEEKDIKDINCVGRLFVHNKSGARLFHLENDDTNKVFSISFRTPPSDSTGLPHILEHSVLCGSKKFPLKDPFIELAKGSLNTYLNAMTFSDKTMYPIASQNEKDFMNLMNVYLDAVFYPNIYNGPETFMQEGWHYEIKNHNEPLSIKGVVYNEMKGAFSSPDQVFFRKIEESLFPDTVYRFDSGGDPDVIPELSYSEFIDFHKKYYHPSNSYIFIYGDGNLMERLEFIDKEYLNKFESTHIESSIQKQTPFNKCKEIVKHYPISEDESNEDKTFISMNYVVGSSTDSEKVLAFTILNYLLLDSPAAPLKKALIDANIGKDVFGSYDSSILQPTFSIIVKNSNEESKDKFISVVNETLNTLINDGINKEAIEAAINIHEFKIREADYGHRPKGLVYNIKGMNSWLYDEAPWHQLEYEKSIENIKTALHSNYFEDIIKEDILSNTHSSLLILKPSKELASKKEQEELERLEKYRKTLSEKEITELIKAKQNLEQYQSKQDSEEDLLSIPLLNLEDINKDVEKIVLNEINQNGIQILHHPDFTNEIAYITLLFDTKSVPQSLIPYTVLLSSILSNIRTENYSYEQLSNLININTGGIYSKIETYSLNYSDQQFSPKLTVKASALINNLPKLFKILSELLNNTKFDEINRIKEIIAETKSRLEMNIFDQGHIMAAKRVGSYFSPIGKYIEDTSGISYYQFITSLDKRFENDKEEIIGNLKEVFNLIFNSNNALVSFTSEEKDAKDIKTEIVSLIGTLPNSKQERFEYNFDLQPSNEGLLTSGKVQYVAKGYNFKNLGYKYSGNMQVLRTIISLDYLWNKVRIEGGAYGSLANFAKNGNLLLSSYRDPNLAKTIDVYNNIHNYIQNLNIDSREMRKYIIGTISDMDTPLSPSMKGDRATTHYITGVTREDLQREREEILGASISELKQYSALFSEAMEKNYLCVLGNENKIKDNNSKFNNLIRIFI